ncbi:hypothetical protein [Phreatobacter oligotrophus]|jgi:hypothetical protein|uniref:Secreted protein n=1 Tax=Phreatobacter oligotrophus TaxID=1122261 RepID=A0A2T4ZIZ9_9HYPH|nr:hypothetical protein [Phreatobacter oligotrophus]PTM61941.1 hypothetical protein C8P69_101615 [Phreatobacter oligotrophus]
MTTRLLATAAAALMASCLSIAPVAQAQTDRDGQQRWINIVNRTNVTIREFYMTDVDTRGWGDDRLGQNVVEPGQALRVVPTPRQRSRGYCQFDMKIVFENERTVERRGVNLCSTSNLVCNSTSSCSAN